MALDRFGVNRPRFAVFPSLDQAIGLLLASLPADVQPLTARQRLAHWWRYSVVVGGVVIVVSAYVSVVWHIRQRPRISRKIRDETAQRT